MAKVEDLEAQAAVVEQAKREYDALCDAAPKSVLKRSRSTVEALDLAWQRYCAEGAKLDAMAHPGSAQSLARLYAGTLSRCELLAKFAPGGNARGNCTEAVQDWAAEATVLVFCDGSKISVPSFGRAEVVE